MSALAQTASQVLDAMSKIPASPGPSEKLKQLARVAAEVEQVIGQHLAVVDRDAEWQRVHSYIADVLKDTHVLYAKLARLEGDFTGEELTRLERISEAVLTLGTELSSFSRSFYEGKYQMAQAEIYGGGGGGGEEGLPPTPEFPTVEFNVKETETEGGEGGEEAGEGKEEAAEGQEQQQEAQ